VERNQLLNWIQDYTQASLRNRISETEALLPEHSGLILFDSPIMGIARADDSLFLCLKEPEAIGPHFSPPESWLPGAKTVISFFFPFTQQVKEANAKSEISVPAAEWLYARIEGQVFLNELGHDLLNYLKTQDVRAVVPAIHPQFWSRTLPEKEGQTPFTSNWSERHVAFICALGTFGLSKGIITRLGMAGRLFSIITDLDLKSDPRPYTDIYEYCIQCGACIKRCPAGAISKQGKDHVLCSDFLNETRRTYAPRYGCGKCQVSVPCESKNPCNSRQ
jgi:epoxyqueuosine reductase